MKILKVCGHCGSEAVWRDANANWDAECQLWVLKDTFPDDWCEDCDGPTTIEDKEMGE